MICLCSERNALLLVPHSAEPHFIFTDGLIDVHRMFLTVTDWSTAFVEKVTVAQLVINSFHLWKKLQQPTTKDRITRKIQK
jgi:hypothetical protein